MEDGSRSRVDVMAAGLARVRVARPHAVMVRDLSTLWTKDAVRVEAILEPFKAGGIVGELAVESFKGITFHSRFHG